MKFLITALCLSGTVAYANPYYDRLYAVEAQERAQGYARAEQTEALATQKLQADLVRITKHEGGLTSSSIKVSLIGNMLIMGSDMSFTTGSNLVCNPMVFNTVCRDTSCSNVVFSVINCFDGNTRLKLDARNGRRYPWPTTADILRSYYKRPRHHRH